ncbi:Thioredoxin domain-containing protein 9-like [Porphyridium purpureum]|uniref:Thioredoxin domain-containing protein 9-like n=1 Tax=Porphyridium purpureum TaxID=35688 RepID=A0A5J4YN52_PORPP|nr:Thioredoxin domain-containing protein 9-like [Porphyridium purpureum]|eukprot:POR1431..scf222_8
MEKMAVERAVLGAARAMEQQVDAQIEALDALKDDDYDALRRRRVEQMKRDAEKRKQWVAQGHGSLQTIDTEMQFFDAVEKSERVCAVFYRKASPNRFTDELIQHLTRIAAQHLEAKFVLLDAEHCEFLVDTMKIWMMPSVALVRNRKSEYIFAGLSEFTADGKMSTEFIEEIMLEKKFLLNSCISDKENTR